MTSSDSPQRLRETVRRYALDHGLLQPGSLVVAVSGGTDSTALLLLLGDLAPELGIVLHAAYFDHRIRRTGAQDAQFVSDLAARIGATIRIGRAERAPKSEDEARQARYAFLRRVAGERNATLIATGHTRDDQAETVLLHLARGSGLAGLAGIRPLRDGIVRPLLSIGRSDTIAVCAATGITPREDPSNRSLRYARNRVRRRVIPELQVINPQVTEALARLADAAADVVASHTARATAALGAATKDGTIDLDAFGADAVVREEALALAWERATGHVLNARHRQAVAAQAERGDGRAALDLPGGRLERDHRTVRIASHAGAERAM
jgi:tRNA(Ile)-lysidine synthase